METRGEQERCEVTTSATYQSFGEDRRQAHEFPVSIFATALSQSGECRVPVLVAAHITPDAHPAITIKLPTGRVEPGQSTEEGSARVLSQDTGLVGRAAECFPWLLEGTVAGISPGGKLVWMRVDANYEGNAAVLGRLPHVASMAAAAAPGGPATSTHNWAAGEGDARTDGHRHGGAAPSLRAPGIPDGSTLEPDYPLSLTTTPSHPRCAVAQAVRPSCELLPLDSLLDSLLQLRNRHAAQLPTGASGVLLDPLLYVLAVGVQLGRRTAAATSGGEESDLNGKGKAPTWLGTDVGPAAKSAADTAGRGSSEAGEGDDLEVSGAAPGGWQAAFLQQLSGLSEEEIQAIMADREPDLPELLSGLSGCGGADAVSLPSSTASRGGDADHVAVSGDTGIIEQATTVEFGQRCPSNSPGDVGEWGRGRHPCRAADGSVQGRTALLQATANTAAACPLPSGSSWQASSALEAYAAAAQLAMQQAGSTDLKRRGEGRRRHGRGPGHALSPDRMPALKPKKKGRSTVGGGGRRGFAGSNAEVPPPAGGRRFGGFRRKFSTLSLPTTVVTFRALTDLKGWSRWATRDPVALSCGAVMCGLTLMASALAVRAWLLSARPK